MERVVTVQQHWGSHPLKIGSVQNENLPPIYKYKYIYGIFLKFTSIMKHLTINFMQILFFKFARMLLLVFDNRMKFHFQQIHKNLDL